MIVHIPSSKSDSQRAIFVAALTSGTTRISQVLACEDTELLICSLKSLGISFIQEGNDYIVNGNGSSLWEFSEKKSVYLGNNGTGSRFCLALSLLVSPSLTITGNEYLAKRPFSSMLTVLCDLGISFQSTDGFLPITSLYNKLTLKTSLDVDVSVSTQYLSAFLLVAPLLNRKIEFLANKPAHQLPYVEMTLRTMREFGAKVDVIEKSDNSALYVVHPIAYRALSPYVVEADWSSASYFYAAAFITGKSWQCSELRMESLQSDRQIVEITEQMKNVAETLELDMSKCLDIIPTVTAMSFYRSSPTVIKGTANLKYKECDRAAVLQREFAKLGGKIDVLENKLIVYPNKLKYNEIIDPEDDHRIAMALYVALLPLGKGVAKIKHPECVGKSFPDFFEKISVFFD